MNAQEKIIATLTKAGKKHAALNVNEIAKETGVNVKAVRLIIGKLKKHKAVIAVGSDETGACYRLGKPVKNPAPSRAKAEAKARKKAKAWFWDENQLDEPRELKGYQHPTSGILIGTMVAIEYESKKDGSRKVYRHDVTKKRNLIISTDGSTMIVDPPFKITKRGIEG